MPVDAPVIITAPGSEGRCVAFIADPSAAAAVILLVVTLLSVTVLVGTVLFIEMTLGTRRGAAICQTTGLTSVEVHVTRMAAFGCGTLLLMVEFSGRVRQWRDDKPGGLAVVDIPEHLVADLRGRRQMRVTGSLNEATFTGSTMLVTGGGMCVGVSKAALKSAGATVGDQVRLSIVAAAS